ncbi:MAG: isochorismate synthase [cyanobacterium endosymbiont of Rhopalodia musculus]|nr:isochorismate synthase [cyanobacterium endosymbiont of Epithemia clementina EcSB]WGT67118.1 isochorismate synthase [cyanobacterium endosymbiont of Epithemia clementina EcSB]
MNINRMLQSLVQYIVEGFSRIFSPVKDECPNIGVQPFDSALYQETSDRV